MFFLPSWCLHQSWERYHGLRILEVSSEGRSKGSLCSLTWTIIYLIILRANNGVVTVFLSDECLSLRFWCGSDIVFNPVIHELGRNKRKGNIIGVPSKVWVTQGGAICPSNLKTGHRPAQAWQLQPQGDLRCISS